MSKIEIPEELYRYRRGEEQIATEQETITPVVKLSWDQGIFLYLEDAEYPQKGMANPQTLWSMNIAKRNFVEPLKLFVNWRFIPSLFLLWLTPKKSLNLLIRSYNNLSWRAVNPFVLKGEYMTSLTQEIEWGIYSFLRELNIDGLMAEQFSQILSSCIEYDNAYRLRIVDILHETTREKLLKNPRKEMKRLAKIFGERETNHVITVKIQRIPLLLGFLLLIPSYKRAFKSAVKDINLKKMQLDEGDRYWGLIRKDGYNYQGKTEEQRQHILDDEGKTRPKLIKRKP